MFTSPINGSEVMTINIDGESLLSVRDLARELGYKRTSDAVKHLPEKHVTKVPNRRLGRSGGGHAVPFTNEAGAYRLILRSNMPRAEEFTDWVTEEVLPTLRKAHEHGIDAIEELKGRIRELDSLVKMHEISAEGEEARGRKQFLNGVRAGRNNPDLDYHAIYEGRFVKWEQADEDEDVLL